MNHMDSPEMRVWALTALLVAIITLAVFGVIDADDTELRRPLAPPAYETLPPVTP